MDHFELVSEYEPTGDQPQAIEKLTKGFQDGNQFETLLGVTGSGKTFTMANIIQNLNKPTLILAHNKTLAAQLYSEFKAFFPHNAVEYFVSYYDYYQPEAYVPSTDTYIEKDSSVNDEIDKLRHSATAALIERKDVIVVSSVSCIYGIGSKESYSEMMISLRPGMIKDRDEVIDDLINIQYVRSELDFKRGTFRVKGGFADVKGTKIIVFYPKNGVSPIQEKQMVTQKGDNTFVVGIHGNFDQAQTGVKKIFGDKEMAAELAAAGYQFSSANSINIGRLVPQIVYYVYAYAKLYANGVIGKDERINVVVPTGNFGNILAAFYAKNMGIPIAKLICASNENKVLYDFFTTGTYDKNREFMLTSSPSMDILISSNLERLIYRIAGNDAAKNADFMKALNTNGKYEITPAMKEQLADFYGNYTSEEETAEEIRNLYEKTGYIIDTHTAVATGVYHKYLKDTKDTDTKTVIASTASPFKFTRSVMDAIDKKYDAMTDFELVDELSKIGNVKIPNAIEEIRTAEVRHKTVCEVDEMPKVVKEFLNVK